MYARVLYANSERKERLLDDTRLCCDYPVLSHEGVTHSGGNKQILRLTYRTRKRRKTEGGEVENVSHGVLQLHASARGFAGKWKRSKDSNPRSDAKEFQPSETEENEYYGLLESLSNNLSHCE